jgi:DNA-binding beta-propeller fold protein YncE
MSGNRPRRSNALIVLGLAAAATLGALVGSGGPKTVARGAQLVSVEPLSDGLTCEWPPDLNQVGEFFFPAVSAAPAQETSAPPLPDDGVRIPASQRKPVRVIQDPYPAFRSVAVDPARNEVVLQDDNFFNVMVYDRLANTPPTAARTEPKRVIGGLRTKVEFQSGLYVDPASGDIYAPNNDTVSTLVIFSRQAQGDVPPTRELTTTHGTYGIAVDEGARQLYLTDQINNAIIVYDKMAKGEDDPIRLLQGDRTGLADPHGIALDTKNRVMFTANHGSVHSKRPGGTPATTLGGGRAQGKRNWPIGERVAGSGRNLPPSITVYAMDAQGDTPPLRTITGPLTQMNWPTGVAFDEARGELYVANDQGESILVFSGTAEGNAAPVRVLKGPKTLIKNPTAVALDTQNNELWVTNYGNHSATVYRMTAEGDTPPLRVIRASPPGVPALMIGNPGALAYDSRREEILAPN